MISIVVIMIIRMRLKKLKRNMLLNLQKMQEEYDTEFVNKVKEKYDLEQKIGNFKDQIKKFLREHSDTRSEYNEEKI